MTFFWYFQCDYALCVSAPSETQNRLQQACVSLPLSFLCFFGKLVINVRVKSNYPPLAHARMSRAEQCRGLIRSKKKNKHQPAVVLRCCSSVLQAAARLLGRVTSFPRDLLSADHMHLTSPPHPVCLSQCVWISGCANYTLIFHVSGGTGEGKGTPLAMQLARRQQGHPSCVDSQQSVNLHTRAGGVKDCVEPRLSSHLYNVVVCTGRNN